jgi:rhodanese-related sulfurtransferase
MKRYLLVPILFLAAIAAFAQGGSEGVEDLEVYRDPESLQELMAGDHADVFLVDVRTPAEYESGHIPGAINIDYRMIGEQPPTDDRDAVIILYCRSGNRSGQAIRTLAGLGYTNTLDWGGIVRWPYDVVTGPEPR